jgi:hypothetical protein
MVLPNASGLEVVLAIERSHPDLPVVLISGLNVASLHESGSQTAVARGETVPDEEVRAWLEGRERR